MADIRKRTGKKGTTYQVRHPSNQTKSGYAFKSFDTLKEARAFIESGAAKNSYSAVRSDIRTIEQAVRKWLDICKNEGRDGRDPVTTFTLKVYDYRADIINSYDWPKPLQELQGPDIIEFRSWLLANYSRDQAKKALSSFQSVMKEMVTRGYLSSNPAIGISVRATSRYDEPIVIPSLEDIQSLLAAADRLANSKNRHIARTWERYRPILYVAADTGMRPQEYLALSQNSIRENGVDVQRAIECGGYKISVTKTKAGRRFINLSPHVYEMLCHYRDNRSIDNKYDLLFPTSTGRWILPDHWRKRGFYAACKEAGLMDEIEEDGDIILKARYKPYDLRHFFASMLIDKKMNLKRIQRLMGHEDITTTLNVYGHLIEKAEDDGSEKTGMLSMIPSN